MRAVGPIVFLSPEQIVQKSIYLAHAHKDQFISVAGPDSLAAMVSLCRDGFDHVECVRQATCRCADGASDALLIVGLMSTYELSSVLQRTCRLLRDGGTLVVQLQKPKDDVIVRSALNGLGIEITSTVVDVSAGSLATHGIERRTALERAQRSGAVAPSDTVSLGRHSRRSRHG
jgi:hypothetical protein